MQAKEFDFAWLSNPEVFEVNRRVARSDHAFYATKAEAVEKKSSLTMSLNGSWKFAFAKNEQARIKGFEAMDFDCNGWDSITVPGHMEMAGYCKPQYVNVQYPWDGHEPMKYGDIPKIDNPIGSYVRYFELPANFKEQRVMISFQGVQAAFAVWLNGTFVGYGEDSFTPSEFELTDLLCAGPNKLAVLVYKYSSASWLEDQDYWRLSGIFREVFLYACPKVHLNDLDVKPRVAEDLCSAELSLKLALMNGMEKAEASDAVVSITLLDAAGKKVGAVQKKAAIKAEKVSVKNTAGKKKADKKAAVREDVISTVKATISLKEDVLNLWSAEDPYLYDLLIEISVNGKVCEVIDEKVGFRRFELKNGLMLINGKRIVFNGTNRHEFSCYTGRALAYEDMVKDVINMKRNNINAIRTSHYPNQTALYRLCDEYGLYMIDETNLETHSTWINPDAVKTSLPGDRKEWLGAVLDRAKSMLMRDRNHAAILIWSCGNESFGGKDIFLMSEYFRKEDPDRIVQYESIVHDRRYNATSDVESWMYPSADFIENHILKDEPNKPMILCEYSHTMGNSGGALDKYIALSERQPRYQGGFIWDYVDQAIMTKDRYGNDYLAYGGDFGDRPCDYNFSGNGIVYADRTNSPKMQTVKFNYQNIVVTVKEDTVAIKNKALFTNTNAYDCFVSVYREGELIEKKALATDVAPLSEKEYALPVKKQKATGEYVVNVAFALKEDTKWAEKGHEVAFGESSYTVKAKNAKSDYYNEIVNGTKKTGKLNVTWGTCVFGVRGDDFEVLFDYGGHGLVSYRYMGREFVDSLIRPNFWRAPVDNDQGNGMPGRNGQWKLASQYGKIVKSKNELSKARDELTVTYDWMLPTSPEAAATLTYVVTADGAVKVILDYKKTEGLPEVPEFGVMMKIPADYDHLTWYGNGPEETYFDRTTGAKLGVYSNLVKDNVAGYLKPQECGNHTGVRYASVTDVNGVGLRFEADGEMEFSAMPYSPDELEAASHAYELPQVHHTVIRAMQRQMGVGGDDSWGAWTHEEYRLKNEDRHFEFRFRGVSK